MTRRGTLVYYLSAWILGCFFMSCLVWIRDTYFGTSRPFTDSAFGLLYFYFFGLVSGAATALIGAFLLRRTMIALKCKTPSHWAIAGAILSTLVVVGLGQWGRHAITQDNGQSRFLELLTAGPEAVLNAGWWLAIPGGAATAFLLCRIQRAFTAEKVSANA